MVRRGDGLGATARRRTRLRAGPLRVLDGLGRAGGLQLRLADLAAGRFEYVVVFLSSWYHQLALDGRFMWRQ